MPSVENFYWILFENLLDPVGLDCWYYHPFGTRQNLRGIEEFKRWQVHKEHHVLFHFDQEPIWTDDFGTYDLMLRSTWSNKIVRIMANSEHSDTKNKICRNRGMLDWYFFYHGFAALDWYRDSRYVNNSQDITKIFCSLNHLVRHKRAYRMALTARLLDRDLQNHGDITFHGTHKDCIQEIEDHFTLLSPIDKKLITKRLCSNPDLPFIGDTPNITGNSSAHFGNREYKFWQKSFLHLVNETVFYDRKLHLTEKIFKPIVALRPFILVSSPGSLRYLRSYGFKTFDNWIDESYDMVEDHDLRLDMITNEVAKLCSKSNQEIQKIYVEMQEILIYNKNHFFDKFCEIIVDELVENFETCIRIWNNGRVDGREIALHPDLKSVRKILLR